MRMRSYIRGVLDPLSTFMNLSAESEGSGEPAHMRRHA